MGSALRDRVAIITGAAAGLGREYALLFAAEGACVVANDVSGLGLDALESEIRMRGGRVTSVAGDIADPTTAVAMVSTAVASFGRLDALVNNAGNFVERPLLDTSLDEWDRTFAIHARGHFLTMQAAARHWRRAAERGEDVNASIVNTTSRSMLTAIHGHSTYGAAKGAVASLSMIAAKELAGIGVRVNAIAPAGRTGMTLGIPRVADQIKAPSNTEFDQWDPGNVAPLVAYLASADCPLTGRLLFCLGGTVQPYSWTEPGIAVARPERWTIEGLAQELPRLIDAEQLTQ